jgi:hypothetical protein
VSGTAPIDATASDDTGVASVTSSSTARRSGRQTPSRPIRSVGTRRRCPTAATP